MRPWQAAALAVVVGVLPARPSVAQPVDPMGGESLQAYLDRHPCAALATSALEAWGARPTAARTAAGAPGTFTMPTASLGTWVVMDVEADGAGRVMRVEPTRTITRTWSNRCVASAESIDERAFGDDARGFTDDVLDRTLARLGSGVIYLWSPHMPLSIAGYRNIVAATERLAVQLVVVLDPRADPRYAADTAATAGLPPEALIPMNSVELTFRELATHAPSIQPFVNGTLLDDMLPGYRDPEHYVQYLRDRFGPH
jgi:hypothetical protein